MEYRDRSNDHHRKFDRGTCSCPPIPESLLAKAPDGRSFGEINGLLEKTTFNFNFSNDIVYAIDGTVANAAIAEHDAATFLGQQPLAFSNAPYYGYLLNGQSNLLFGSNTVLSPVTNNPVASHGIQNYTIAAPGNNFVIGPNGSPI